MEEMSSKISECQMSVSSEEANHEGLTELRVAKDEL